MEALVHQPLYELFFVLASLRPRQEEYARTLAALDGPGAPLLRGVDLYYRGASDVALLALRYDERAFDRARLSWVAELGHGLGVPLLDPSRMADGDRQAFYRAYLPTYDVRLEDRGTVGEAIAALADRLAGRTPAGPRPPGPARGPLGKLAPGHASPSARQALPLAEQARIARQMAIARASTRAPTVPAMASYTARRRVATAPTPEIDVRFLRGGQWTLARLRALSVKGAYLVTGAPPRQDDEVHVAIGFRDHGALLRGTVYHVTSAADALTTGSSGFALRFPGDNSAGKRQLVELLTAARAAGVTIKPPPARHAVRFPVCWPVQVGLGDASVHGEALDVSSGGLFVAANPSSRIEIGDEVSLAIPLEQDEAVTMRARVARVLSAETASARGVRGGFGLELTEVGELDRRHWDGFLDRVRRRTERRIVVGASPARIDELSAALAAGGYAVTAGSDPSVLMQVAELDARLPDAVVIEAGLAAQGPDHWLEQVFSARNVPCVTVRGDGRRTRCVVDRLLQVVA